VFVEEPLLPFKAFMSSGYRSAKDGNKIGMTRGAVGVEAGLAIDDMKRWRV